jgi:hypothetical protein
MRGGVCTENPDGTTVKGSLSSMRTTSLPPCGDAVMDCMVASASAVNGETQSSVNAIARARQLGTRSASRLVAMCLL